MLQDGPEDDDAWMTGGAADLEAELQQRQKELGDDVAKHAERTAKGLGDPQAMPEFDPSQMASKMKVLICSSCHDRACLDPCKPTVDCVGHRLVFDVVMVFTQTCIQGLPCTFGALLAQCCACLVEGKSRSKKAKGKQQCAQLRAPCIHLLYAMHPPGALKLT